MIEFDLELTPEEIRNLKKMTPRKVFGCCLLPLVVVGGIGFFLFQQYEGYVRTNQAKVAAVIQQQLKSTPTGPALPDSSDPFDRYYKEAYAVLPYSKTHWKSIVDQVFAYAYMYPDNTSALVKDAQGDQIWFLRRDGYMFRINIYQSKQKLMDFYNSLGNKENYIPSQTTFAGKPALLLTQKDQTASIIANEYIVANNRYIYLIWYQMFPQDKYPDDAQRVQFMLSNFRFIQTG